MKSIDHVDKAIDVVVKIGFLLILAGWCFQILSPFINPVIWGIIIAVAVDPLFQKISKVIPNRTKLTSIIVSLILIVLILIPTILFFESAVVGLQELGKLYREGNLVIPEPNANVQAWPLIGEWTYTTWTEAHNNLTTLLMKHQDSIMKTGKLLFNSLVGTGMGILELLLSVVISGVLLATHGTKKASHALFEKIAGSFGAEFASISEKTIRNVVKGILGVAVIQSILFGIGFVLAGVPYAGLWVIIVLILAVIQLPPMLVVIPVVIYLFSANSTLYASLWTAYLLLAGLSDNILKPILLGQGAPVPMLVIFLGSIGGFITSGFIGLFIGAIILSLGYKLLVSWLDIKKEPLPEPVQG
ncbi:MAG: AI-2E family transporter [Reichenbachiella sp.]